jgi:hypothetical protein
VPKIELIICLQSLLKASFVHNAAARLDIGALGLLFRLPGRACILFADCPPYVIRENDERMPVNVQCPACNTVQAYQPSSAGGQAVCASCGAPVSLPTEPDGDPAKSDPTPLLPVRPSRPLAEPSDGVTDLPGARTAGTYRPHRHEAAQGSDADALSEAAALDPLQWRPVRAGLALILWSWIAILGFAGLFVVCFFLTRGDAFWAVARLLAILAAGGCLVSFAGQCLCLLAPATSRARGLVLGSVVGTAVAVVSFSVLLWSGMAQAAQDQIADDRKQEPAEQKQDVPDNKKSEPADDAKHGPPGEQKQDAPETQKQPVRPAYPRLPIPMPTALLITAVYLAGHALFVLFLRKVALIFNDLFTAERTGGYLTLFILHALLAVLLPPAAMVACYFGVVMLGLEVVLVVWYVSLVIGTRKAIG